MSLHIILLLINANNGFKFIRFFLISFSRSGLKPAANN